MSYFLTAIALMGLVWLVVSMAEAREQMERWDQVYEDEAQD